MSDFSFGPVPLYLLETDAQGNRIHILREDLLPYSFGGNKVRIGLEYLKDMMARGGTHMVAYGNARSNLCRVLSNLCAGKGIPLTILSPADEDGQRRPAFNERLCHTLGARIVPCLKTGVAEAVDRALEEIRRQGGVPYYLYGDRLGQGNLAVPVAAYAGVYPEILAREKALELSFDAIFLAAGTGMTQAGLLCGQALGDAAGAGEGKRRIVGISVARPGEEARAHVAAYCGAYLAAAHTGASVPPDRIEIRDEFRGSYGVHDAAVGECIRRVLARHGVPLEGTYTGKAFYGMEQVLRSQNWQGRDVLFIHTGGLPLFFDGALEGWAGRE